MLNHFPDKPISRLEDHAGVAGIAVWTEVAEVLALVPRCCWWLLHHSYSQSDVSFGCLWVMSRASLSSVPVPQGRCPLRENSVCQCFWQPCSHPGAVVWGGTEQQRWLIPPQWLSEELQGEAIYNRPFRFSAAASSAAGGGRNRDGT